MLNMYLQIQILEIQFKLSSKVCLLIGENTEDNAKHCIKDVCDIPKVLKSWLWILLPGNSWSIFNLTRFVFLLHVFSVETPESSML